MTMLMKIRKELQARFDTADVTFYNGNNTQSMWEVKGKRIFVSARWGRITNIM